MHEVPSSVSQRDTRLQAAVLRRAHILVIEMLVDDGRRFWLLPGGGREPDDVDEAAAVAREVREEVALDVAVVGQLLDVAAHPNDLGYRRYRTFLCFAPTDAEPVVGRRDGTARIGQARWLSLTDMAEWGRGICDDEYLYPQLLAIQRELER